MKKTTYLGSALVIAMTFVASGAMAQDKCGLGNGKKASGEPIQIGAAQTCTTSAPHRGARRPRPS